MSREYWFFLGGALTVLIPVLAVLAVKRLQLFEPRPDLIVSYGRAAERDLTLHAFFPDRVSPDRPVPALLLFHGGRWQSGSPRAMYPQCRYFAAQGIACFSAAYRLGSRSIVDVRGAIEDAGKALQFLHEQAGSLGIDPSRIYAGGGSSGGHLAAALGAALPPETSSGLRPAALILYNPMLDLAPGEPDSHLVRGYWQSVSPRQHVDSSYPPTLILSGTEDPEVPVATVEDFCDAVRSAGGRCEAQFYAGESHGFFNYFNGRNPYFDQTGERALEFLGSL